MPSGVNGPYNDLETPVRNTSHWLITFSKAYELTDKTTFKVAVEKCAQYLTSDESRPFGKTFYHRKKEGKDFCNGLIGQAWTIEALACASKTLGDKSYKERASDVFNIHPFDEKKKLWQRVDPDGTILDYDLTFNHQLWFCMSGALIMDTAPIIEKKVGTFLNHVLDVIDLSSNGRIGQTVFINIKENVIKLFMKKLIRQSEIKYLLLKEVGYHAFNTYAFSVLKQILPDHRLWSLKKFIKVINYLNSAEYKTLIELSKYGFKYNPPGFEVLFTQKVFNSEKYDINTQFGNYLFNKQIDVSFSKQTWLMTENCFDANTNAARIYEASRILAT